MIGIEYTELTKDSVKHYVLCKSQLAKLHRETGPAVIKTNGDVEYWIEGKQISEIEFLELKKNV